MKAVDWPVSRGHLWPFWWFLIPEPYIILITSAIVQDHPTPKDRPFSYWDLSFYLFFVTWVADIQCTHIYIYISKIYIHCIIIYICTYTHCQLFFNTSRSDQRPQRPNGLRSHQASVCRSTSATSSRTATWKCWRRPCKERYGPVRAGTAGHG